MNVKGRVARAVLGRLEAWSAEYETQRLAARLGARGQGGTLASGIRVTAPQHMYLGDNVHIGRDAWIRAEGGLEIGDNVHISRRCLIYTVNHQYRGTRLPYDDELVHRPVRIGANVWIGMNVSIAPGTQIGDGAIVAMAACISGVVPPMAIVGNPKWRVLGARDTDHYEDLVKRRRFGGADGAAWGNES